MGYRGGAVGQFAAGQAQACAEMERDWHAIADPASRSGTSHAEADPDMIRAAKRAESVRRQGRADAGRDRAGNSDHPERLDAHPYLLNCRNGIVDLQTGDLRGHDPYEPDAEGVVFREFLGASSQARTCGFSSSACSASHSRAR